MRIWRQAIRTTLAGAGLGLGLGLVLGSDMAHGSAWPRAQGSGFVSFSFEATTTRAALEATDTDDGSPDFAGYRSLYAELGVTPRLTLGLDFGADDPAGGRWAGRQMTASLGLPTSSSSHDSTDWPHSSGWTGIAFARLAIGPLDARHRFALSLGAGARRYEVPGLFYGLERMTEEPVLRASAAWGAGFDGPLGPGWASLAGSVERRLDTGGEVRKLDATLGLKPEGRLTYILQVHTGDYPDSDPYAKLVPSVVTHLTDRLALDTGAIWGLHGTDVVGLKVALWFEW